MNLREIKETPLFRKKRTRVGRGCGSGGSTSGRGNKGEKARSGCRLRILFEGGTTSLFRRVPKRGFNNARFQKDWITVNLEDLNELQPGSEVTLKFLEEAKILKLRNKKYMYWKLLGKGDLKVENLTIKTYKISKQAREKLEQAKGKVEIIQVQPKNTKSRRTKA